MLGFQDIHWVKQNMQKLCTSSKIPNHSPLRKCTRYASLDKIKWDHMHFVSASLPLLVQWPKDSMQLLFQILMSAFLLCRQFLCSSSGSINNTKPCYKSQSLFLSNMQTLHISVFTVSISLLKLLILRLSPLNVITTSKQKWLFLDTAMLLPWTIPIWQSLIMV